MANEKILLVPYSASWPGLFEAERNRLTEITGNKIVAFEHIGSTAVEGLSAKPVIDIIAGVDSMKTADELLPLFCRNGYLTSAEFNATLPERHFLMRLNDAGARTHHLHLIPYQGKEWNESIVFRNILRTHGDIAKGYFTLKEKLAEKFPDDREAYTNAKSDFVKEVVARFRPHP